MAGSGQRGGMFYINSATTPTVSNGNSFKYNYLAFRGGAVSLYNTKFFDTNSYYENNAAIYGGQFYCSSCSMTF